MLRTKWLQHDTDLLQSVSGLTATQFSDVVKHVLPSLQSTEQSRLNRPNRQRAIGGGPKFELMPCDQILLTLIWLYRYPTHETMARLFGVSDSTVGRYIKRVRPILKALGYDHLIHPEPSRKNRPKWNDLVIDIPQLTTLIQTEKDVDNRSPNGSLSEWEAQTQV